MSDLWYVRYLACSPTGKRLEIALDGALGDGKPHGLQVRLNFLGFDLAWISRHEAKHLPLAEKGVAV